MWIRIVAALALVLPSVASGPAWGAKKTASVPAADLVWPLPPDAPRVRYVRTMRGEADFAKKRGSVARFLLGAEADPGLALRKPYGVTTDATGRIYVADTGLRAVLIFDPNGRKVRILGEKGRVRLRTPIGLATDEQGRLFVSDADLDEVLCFDSREDVVLALGHGEGLKNPAGIAIDKARRRLYVADSHLHQIIVYSTDGRFLERRGGRGSAAGRFNFPTNIALDAEGNLYVVDTGNFRVQIFDPEGRHLRSFGEAGDGPGSFHRPKGIAVDGNGSIYVVDAAFNNFQIFDREGRLLLFVGAVGRDPGSFWLPAGIHIDGNDRVYVADQVNRRVQVFQYVGDGPSTKEESR